MADLRNQDFPDTVLFFELECGHPALRVIEIKIRFMHSNLDLNLFPGRTFRVDSLIRKEFHVYRF